MVRASVSIRVGCRRSDRHGAVLAPLAVHPGAHPQHADVRDFIGGQDRRPQRAKTVQALAEKPLLVLLLQAPREVTSLTMV